MSADRSDDLRGLPSRLAEVLGDAKISFSAHCVSGLVGREICQCWRCRGVEPSEEHPKWARAAELISGGFEAETRLWLRKRRAEHAARIEKTRKANP